MRITIHAMMLRMSWCCNLSCVKISGCHTHQYFKAGNIRARIPQRSAQDVNPPCRAGRGDELEKGGPRATTEGGPAPAARPWPSAPTSMGSPRGVPVPCTLTSATSAGDNDAMESAALTSAVCAGPLGAVSPLERPAWLYAEPAVGVTCSLLHGRISWAMVQVWSLQVARRACSVRA